MGNEFCVVRPKKTLTSRTHSNPVTAGTNHGRRVLDRRYATSHVGVRLTPPACSAGRVRIPHRNLSTRLTVSVAFGQHAGPPATSRQVDELLALLQAAGHEDFRDARGPMGFTQRQAAGKFTRDEAERLIARLQAASDEGGLPAELRTHVSKPESLLRGMPAELLAGELQRRGWLVVEP